MTEVYKSSIHPLIERMGRQMDIFGNIHSMEETETKKEMFIISIDIGHCETAAAYYDPGETEGQKVKSLKIGGGNDETATPTALFLTEDQFQKLKKHRASPGQQFYLSYDELIEIAGNDDKSFIIGNDIPDNLYGSSGVYYHYFKTDPKNFGDVESGISKGDLMACFIFSVFQNILRYNKYKHIPSKENISLYVGCPASRNWTKESMRNEYAALIRRATGVNNVTIMPESRAALFSAIDRKDGKISLGNGLLVIDSGSLTLDWTYKTRGKPSIENSCELGASLIEMNMEKEIRYGIKPESLQFSISDQDVIANCRTCRREKEEYYTKIEKLQKLPNPLPLSKMIKPRQINYEVNNETMVKPDIGYSFMEYITGHDEKKENGVIINVNWGSRQNIESGTWKQLCEKFFNEIKKEIGHNPISTILLTGGGSNMYFIKEICKDVFKDRNVNILLSDNPSFSVAYGLCYAAVSDLKFGEYVNAAVDGINPKIKNLNKDILKGLVKKIMEIAQDNISYWISPDSGIELGSQSTIEWLMNHVQTGGDVQMKDRTIKRLMGIEPDLKINDICEESIEGLKDHISSCIAKLVNNSIKSLYSDNISNEVLLTKDILDDVLDIKIPKIEASKVFKRIDYRGFWFWLFDADPEKEYTMERPLNNIFYGRKHVVKKYFEPNLQNLIERELTKENGVMSIIWESINKSIRSSIENAFNIAMLKDEN